jgi:hypothetical protein
MGDDSASGSPKAGWYADPTGRHQYRYWDGAQWTPHVADEGVASVDEMQAPAGAQGAWTESVEQGRRPAGWQYYYPSDVQRLAAERDVATIIEVLDKVGLIPDTHAEAATALGTIGDPLAVPALVRALKDRYSTVRRAAAVALGSIGDARAFQPLIAALGDGDGFMRTDAAQALGRIGDPRAVEPIVAAIKTPSHVGSYKPVPALTLIGVPAVEPLVAALRDDNHNVRYWSAIALGQIGDPRAVEPLIAALKDSNGPVRREAAEALRALGRPDAIEVSTGAQEPGGSPPGPAAKPAGTPGADDGIPDRTFQSDEDRDSGAEMSAHDRAHEMIARLQMLIVTSSEVAIPGYLQDKATSDLVEAVAVCDNLLKDGEEATSLYHVVVGQAREAFLQEIYRR